jgi:putative ABC transport system permease protein
MLSQDLGVKINQVLVVEAPVSTENYEEKIESFKNELKASAGIVEVTGSGAIPGKEVGQFLANRTLHSQPKDARLYEMLQVDYSFIKMYDLELIAGRDFDKGRPSDKYGLILNESAVRQFGYESPQKAVGEKILLEVNRGRANEIIGVIKDYHQQSLQQKFTPIILFMDPDYKWIPVDFYSIKVQTQSVNALIEKVQQAWGRFFPESSFDYYFLDDFFNRQYQQDRQFGRTFMVFSSLAIIIACMGLFGLTSYNTARRTKEIGIRKVLGASVNSILSLLAWDTLKLILFSGMVAIPLSWYLVNQWLENYAFRIELSWWHGFVPLLILISIALATISYLSLKAALTNPSRSLRNE